MATWTNSFNAFRCLAGIVALLVALGTTTACQPDPDIAMLDELWELVEENHYDPDLHGLNWADLHSQHHVLVKNADSREESLQHINAMLNRLGDSHCAVGALANAARASSPYLFASGSLGIDIRMVDPRVLITGVKAGSSAAEAGVQPGFTLVAVDGLSVQQIVANAASRPPFTDANRRFHQTEAILWHLDGKAGTTVAIEYLDAADRPLNATLKRVKRKNGIDIIPEMPPIFARINSAVLAGNINYLSFNAFQPDHPARILRTIKRLDQDNPLIIDLRGNNGGSANATTEILSSLAGQEFLAYQLIGRENRQDVHIEPSANGYAGKIVVMVDELSISAAENFAGILQHTGLARVVGTRTPGQLLWGEGFALANGFLAVIPTARIVYPDGTEVEGHGVEPDLLIDLRREDLLRGVDTQLQASIEILQEQWVP